MATPRAGGVPSVDDMISVRGLTKRYGGTLAVNDVTFDVRPGTVTGFLGPNGSGKSTTMRLIMGLDAPTSGTALIGGAPYRSLRWPLHTVGAVLEARSFHPGRTARSHLRALAAAGRIPRQRADEVLEQVGLAHAANRRAGTFSLGMAQRLGIAAALLGDPGLLLLDEPVNGLDPDGVRWIRGLIRSQAAAGRTVLVSSHLIGEMAQTADRVIVIGHGRLLADTSLEELTARGGGSLEDAFFGLTEGSHHGSLWIRVQGSDGGGMGETPQSAVDHLGRGDRAGRERGARHRRGL